MPGAGCLPLWLNRHLATEEVRAERQAEEARVVAEIRAIHAEHHGGYGAPRVHAELRARGGKINRKQVARLMRINHVIGRHLRRRKRTTVADKTAPPAPDLMMRDFTAKARCTRSGAATSPTQQSAPPG